MLRRTIAVLVAALAAGPLVTPAGAAESRTLPGIGVIPGCGPMWWPVRGVTEERDWAPLTPSRWDFPGTEIVQVERGTAPEGPRRPFEYAVLTAGPEFGSVRYDAEVRLDEPVTRNDRDVVLIFNYRSPTRFAYVHLSQDNTIYPHNGIFVVNDADRLRIDDQWNGSVGAPPAVDDTDWHAVRLDYCARTGAVAVYVDGAREPLMTATETTLRAGRVGFGSFDNYGRARDVEVTGWPAIPAWR